MSAGCSRLRLSDPAVCCRTQLCADTIVCAQAAGLLLFRAAVCHVALLAARNGVDRPPACVARAYCAFALQCSVSFVSDRAITSRVLTMLKMFGIIMQFLAGKLKTLLVAYKSQRYDMAPATVFYPRNVVLKMR